MIDAVPGQRALHGAEARRELLAGLGHIESMPLAVHARHHLVPEMIVVGEIEQRSVEVQQQRLDARGHGRSWHGHGPSYAP
jgi:hypothetical protein